MDFVRSTLIEMNLWPVEHFCPPFFQISANLEKNGGQTCSTVQRFIFTEVTFYKIHILVYFLSANKVSSKPLTSLIALFKYSHHTTISKPFWSLKKVHNRELQNLFLFAWSFFIRKPQLRFGRIQVTKIYLTNSFWKHITWIIQWLVVLKKQKTINIIAQ